MAAQGLSPPTGPQMDRDGFADFVRERVIFRPMSLHIVRSCVVA